MLYFLTLTPFSSPGHFSHIMNAFEKDAEMDAEWLLDRFPSGFLNVSSLRPALLIYSISVKTILVRTDGKVAQVFQLLRL